MSGAFTVQPTFTRSPRQSTKGSFSPHKAIIGRMVELEPVVAASGTRLAARAAFAWMIVAVVLQAVILWRALDTKFSYTRAGLSAEQAVMARSFFRHGLWNLRFAPIDNNPPLGLERSPYVHWPPLTPVLLSLWFRMFGISERSTHAFALLAAILLATALYLLARHIWGSLGASVAVLAWLALPVTRAYAHLLDWEDLAVALSVWALFCAMKALAPGANRRPWQWAGVLAVAVAVASSWEAAFLAIGLWVAGALTRRFDVIRIALAYAAAALSSAAAVFALYWSAYPSLALQTLRAALYRTGLLDFAAAGLLHREAVSQLPRSQLLTLPFLNLLLMFGSLGLLALGIAIVSVLDRRSQPLHQAAAVALIAATVSWLCWYVLFLNHVAIHDMETIIAAPSVALAVAWCAVTGVGYLTRQQAHRWRLAAFLLLPFIGIFPLVLDCFPGLGRVIGHTPGFGPSRYTDHLVELGRDIRRLTPAGSIVLTPEDDMVPAFYSGRHTIRVVQDAAMVEDLLPQVRQNFQHAPVYLAVTPETQDAFLPLLDNPRLPQTRTNDVILLQLSPD